ncbi:MAG: response regulator, partial [Thermodesulfobacteriota bacterium]|nr:response regulator [Thermodesulfobacteriota bacterium]
APPEAPPAAPPAAPTPVVASVSEQDTTLRVSSARLDDVMRRAEGMIALKLAAAQRYVEGEQLSAVFPVWKKQWKLSSAQWRRNLKCLDSLSLEECRTTIEQMSGYIDQTQHHFQALETGVSRLKQSLFQDKAAVDTMVEELLDDVKEIIMVPFSNVAASFPRMLRDISRSQAKQVEFIVRGEDVELDKRILEKIVSPLTHLLRNAVDHGIELPQERLRAGKEAGGRVEISLSRTKGGRVEIRISDDGRGIDPQRLRDKAVAQGVMTQEMVDKLSHDEALALIFNSGLSTSAILTEISGRGLGMAIVKDEVEKLGGHVHVETTIDKGSCFKLHLPVSLSVFRGILVHVRGHNLVLPTTAVERVIKVARTAIKTVENREVIVVDGVNLALVEMGDILSIAEMPITQGDYLQIAVVRDAEQRLGFVVDAVDGEYELLVKGLGHHLQGLRFFSGASVLGDGRVVPILDPRDLLVAPRDGGAIRSIKDAGAGRMVKRILVVDDSITSRMLIKNILEAAGYQVVSAIDGVDAYDKVVESSFDLVVSDVEMPRMDGFELTTRIRATESVAPIPVILVTSLETNEDKEKGIDAGANAYIVKRSFDQTNLLDTVKRLL